MSESVSDEELVVRLGQGDAEALRALMERHQGPLHGYLVRLLASREDADDLFQEAFLRVVRHAQNFDRARTFRPWLYTIATNLVKNTYRSRSYRDAASLDKEDERGQSLSGRLAAAGKSPSEHADLSERAERVRALVARLPEKGRLALVLYYYQGLSYNEIGEVLEIPLGTVKSRIHNALGKLTQELASDAPLAQLPGGEA